jgi:transcriptional regulator with XRE-family HTH domain
MSPAKKAMTADELRTLLERAGVSQLQLATKLGIDKGTVNRWATGKSGINQFVANAIRAALKSK